MAINNKSIVLSCEVDGKEDMFFVRLDLVNATNDIVCNIEFADITNDVKDLLEANQHFLLYEGVEEIKSDLANAHLSKFLNEDRESQKLDVLFNLVNKMRHSQGVCKDGCIHCNPDLGEDPLPDFTFGVKKYDVENKH